jgi:hypothetical protein
LASLFISHSSSDQDAAQRLGERLRAEGFAALFIDFDPDQGIPAGRNWERELYSHLRKTDAVIFLASAASVASRWCFLEVGLARSLGKPVFPLSLNGDARLALLEDAQWVDLAEGELAFTKLWAGLRRAGLDPTDSFSWDPTRRPYPGLKPFAPEDAAVFFGREHEIERLLELVQPTLVRGVAGRVVAIVGPSGSGKSSLLRAGLLPRLEHLKERWVVVPPVRPGKQPPEIWPAASLRLSAPAAGSAPLPSLRGGSVLFGLSIYGLGDLLSPFEREACRLADPGCTWAAQVANSGGTLDAALSVVGLVLFVAGVSSSPPP